MAQYVYDLSKNSDIKKLNVFFDNLGQIFTTMKFKKFIADKCLIELDKIQNRLEYQNENPVFLGKVEEYKGNHKVKLDDDYIIISNATDLTQSEMYWVSEKTRAKYPNGISVSYIIEYGTGLVGTPQDDWETNVNGHSKSWSYKQDEKIYHTRGVEGRFVYEELLKVVSNKIGQWMEQYLKKEMD